jgi:hypothetical protein
MPDGLLCRSQRLHNPLRHGVDPPVILVVRANRQRETVADHVVAEAFGMDDGIRYAPDWLSFVRVAEDDNCFDVAGHVRREVCYCFVEDLSPLAVDGHKVSKSLHSGYGEAKRNGTCFG